MIHNVLRNQSHTSQEADIAEHISCNVTGWWRDPTEDTSLSVYYIILELTSSLHLP